jgi:hypothetical protein
VAGPCDIGSDTPGLVAGEKMRRRAPTGLILEIGYGRQPIQQRSTQMPNGSDAFFAEGGSAEYDFLAIPGSKPPPKYGYLTWTAGDNPRFQIGGSLHGFYYGVVGAGGYSWGTKAGPEVNQYSSYAGVLGTGIYVTGVAGTSLNNVGVYGQAGEIADSSIPQSLSAGVVGVMNIETPNQCVGVYGQLLEDNPDSPIPRYSAGVFGASYYQSGVMGWSHLSPAVYGESNYSPAVWGQCYPGTGVFGVGALGAGGWSAEGYFGVYGSSVDDGPWPTSLSLPDAAGVFGTAADQVGVIGTSTVSAGVLGYSRNNVGVYGQTTNSASYAGFFKGNVKITGTLTAAVKHAVVPFPDGTQRLLHCMESPEHWFEDFGSATLKNGRAVVNLDADFAKVIKRGDYRVFVTPEGDCRGLYVRRKSAKSFEVREL